MRTLSELIFDENAWTMINEWISKSETEVQVLKNKRAAGEEALLQLQITNKSTLGAITLESSGLLIDKGWVRILGSGSQMSQGSILSWNGFTNQGLRNSLEGGLIIGYDVVGGFFAINNGAFDKTSRNVYYFAPDTLEWENTEKGYTDFLYWTLFGDLDKYYRSFRWNGWEHDVKKLTIDEGIMIYPYLWTQQSNDINKCHKEVGSIREIWELQNEYLRQLKGE